MSELLKKILLTPSGAGLSELIAKYIASAARRYSTFNVDYYDGFCRRNPGTLTGFGIGYFMRRT